MPRAQKLTKTRSPGVYRTSSGLFCIRWTVQQRGRRQDCEETFPEGTTHEAAVKARADRIAAARASEPQAPQLPSLTPTLADYATSWLARKRPDMKLRAAESYAQVLRDWVFPTLGHIRVDDLRRSDLEAWVSFVTEWAWRRKRAREPQPYEPIWWVLASRETLKGWWTKLKQIVRDACAEYDLRDVTSRVRGPKAYGRPLVQERDTLTFDELAMVIDELEEHWRDEVRTEMATGMRPGELYELHWDTDVDFARDRITISRSHSRGVVGATKTGKVKVYNMGPWLARLLRARRERQVAEQGEALSTGLVFPASESGTTGWRRRASSLRNVLVRAGRRAGIETLVTPQVLRRTFRTLLEDEGISENLIDSLMGHSSKAMGKRYYGAQPEAQRAAVIQFERKLGGGG